MLFLVIEHYKNRDPKPIYERVRDSGRALPDGLTYIDSWVESNFDRCFQLMETDDLRTIQKWISFWTDLVEFEVIPVVPSKDTAAHFTT